MPLTKSEIIAKINDRTGLHKNESAEMLEAVLDIIKTTLESGENVKVHGFGNFEIKQKKDRKGRNPQTGESLIIGARRVVTFKPSVILRAAVNGHGGENDE